MPHVQLVAHCRGHGNEEESVQAAWPVTLDSRFVGY